MRRTREGLLATFIAESPVLRILVVGNLLGPLSTLLLALLGILILAVLYTLGLVNQITAPLLLLSVILALVAILVGVSRLRSQLLKPLAELEQAVADVCEGEPWSNLPLETVGVLGPVTRDLDSLSGELIDIYEDMDDRVARQTRHLGQQTASLKILYDVAANINQVDDMDELLLRLMRVLKEMLHGRAATVQLTSTSGQARLVGSIGPDGELLSEKQQLPIPLCACGQVLSRGDIICSRAPRQCLQKNNRLMFGADDLRVVRVPLGFHGDILGMFRIYVPHRALEDREDLIDLFATIGNHLGIAIAKQRSDEEAHRLSIIEERTALANELHDSLAQTLASLRFQVRMLEETLEQEQFEGRARREISRIRNGLDEAHTELRELLNSFRAPLDQRGLEPALEKMAHRFRQETGISIFYQSDCRQVSLGASEEMQMLRIVQECLANIRKHAQAQTVRILLTCNGEEGYRLLVEDDGIGFINARPNGHPGEHIGLSIMEERARRLGGKIKIESEPGEGTRVELSYNSRTENL